MKHYIILPLLASLATGATIKTSPFVFEDDSEFDSFFDDIDKQIRKEMKRAHKKMRKAFKSSQSLTFSAPQLTINEHETTNAVTIEVSPLQFKNPEFDASFDEDNNTITITTPAGSLIVQKNRTYVAAAFTAQLSKKDESDDRHSLASMSSSSQVGRNVLGDINLDDARIEYDTDAQKLLVTIPAKQKVVNKLQVTVKNKEAQISDEK